MEAKRKVSNVAPVLFQHLSWVTVVLEPLDQETGLPTHILGITHHTKPSLVTGHCTHLRAGTWEPLLLFACQSSSVHGSLLGITMKKPNRPCFFPDDLKCPANVSPLNNRCAGPQARADSRALFWEALWRWYPAGSSCYWARLKENLWLILPGPGSGQKLENCYRVTHWDPN